MESNGVGLGKLLPKGIRRRKRESREDMSASSTLAAATSDISTNGSSVDGDGNLDSTPRSMAKSSSGGDTTIGDDDNGGLAPYESEGES